MEQDVFRDHVDVLYDGLAHGHVHGVARQLRDARRGGVVAGLAESLLRHSSSAFMWMRVKGEAKATLLMAVIRLCGQSHGAPFIDRYRS